MTVAAPTYVDETQIRDLYQRTLDSWQDAAAYAQCFTPDADYIIGNGKLERGWKEIIEGQEIIFSGWARDTSLEGSIDRIRFLSDDVAILIAYGRIVFDHHRSNEDNMRTIYTLTAQKLDEAWTFVAYQNTPLGGH